MSPIALFLYALLAGVYRLPFVQRRHGRVSNPTRRKLVDAALIVPSLFHSLYLNVSQQDWNGKVNLGIVAIMKNEGPYLLEWIEYHRSIGFEKFYLYDNESTDDTSKLLEPYIRADIVEYTWLPGKARQVDAYNDVLNKHAADCKFLAVIDLDEFINFGNNDVLAYLNNHVTGKVSGLAINWLIFGSSGWTSKPKGLVLENFTQRSEYSFPINRHVKTIVNPRAVLGFASPHYAVPLIGYSSINTRGDRIKGSFSSASQSDTPPVINHYFCKSKQEYREKLMRGRAANFDIRRQEEFSIHDRNDVTDTSMHSMAIEVKGRIDFLRNTGSPEGCQNK